MSIENPALADIGEQISEPEIATNFRDSLPYNEGLSMVSVPTAKAMINRPNKSIEGFYLDNAEALSERHFHLDGHAITEEGVSQTKFDIRLPGTLSKCMSWVFGVKPKATVTYMQFPGMSTLLHEGAKDRYKRLEEAEKEKKIA